jgi:ABC-type phosphonate transport system ATPase subunit
LKGQARAQHGQNVSNGHNLNENMPDWSVSMYGQIGNNSQHENGNMPIDSEAIDHEMSFAVGHKKREDK